MSQGGGDRSRPVPGAPGANPDPLGALLGEVVAQRDWGTRLAGANVHARWREIAGAQLAEHCEPVRLHGGVLVIRAETPAWASQLRYLSGDIATRAAAVLEDVPVTSVRIVTGTLRGDHGA